MSQKVAAKVGAHMCHQCSPQNQQNMRSSSPNLDTPTDTIIDLLKF